MRKFPNLQYFYEATKNNNFIAFDQRGTYSYPNLFDEIVHKEYFQVLLITMSIKVPTVKCLIGKASIDIQNELMRYSIKNVFQVLLITMSIKHRLYSV